MMVLHHFVCGTILLLLIGWAHSTVILEDSVTKTHCLLMDFSGVVSLKKDTGGYKHEVINDSLVYFGNCRRNATEQFPYENIQLTVIVKNETALTFNFIQNKLNNETYLMRMFYAYYNETAKDMNVADNRQVSMNLSHAGVAYECNTSRSVRLNDNVDVTLDWMKYQAFHVDDDMSYSATVETCSKWSEPIQLQESTFSLPETTTQTSTMAPAPLTTEDPTGIPTYYVTDPLTHHLCILMRFFGSFRIPYTKVSGSVDIAEVNMDHDGAAISGSCGQDVQSINIEWQPKNMPANDTDNWWTLRLEFSRVSNTTKYALTNMTVVYYLEEKHFINTKEKGRREITHYFKSNELEIQVNETFVCFSGKVFNFNEKTGFGVDLKHLQMEVFRSTDSMQFGDIVCACSEDNTLNAIVPILVGSALGLLMMIVLISYFVSRNRRSGYIQM